jgi:hypothetical protein
VNDSLTIIVLTNLGEAHSDVLKIVGRIGSLYLPDTKGANLVKDW